MSFDALLDRFTRQAPVATMVRAAMANVLSSRELDAIFHDRRQRQYEDELLFSSVVGLLTLVVTKTQKSLHAAYQAERKQLGVSAKALYDKLAGVELPVTRELVRRTAERMAAVVDALAPARAPLLPGYRTLVLDGSHLAATEHRLQETRRVRGGPLPGQGLVVLDADRRLIVDFLPSEDGHEQERNLLPAWVDLLGPGQLWLADRNFCTKLLLFECRLNGACFLVREHAGLKWEACGPDVKAGRCATGEVWEQQVRVRGAGGETLLLRRITLYLDEPTSEGERRIHFLTNLPPEVSAMEAADTHHRRWDIERAFGELTLSLRGEIDTLAYPRAALLGYAVALVTYNLLAVVRAALRAVHGAETVDAGVSTYYLANEVTSVWLGMEIALPAAEWNRRYGRLPPEELARELVDMARHTHLRHYRKHPRGPKKKPPPRRDTGPHVSTARLLATRQRR
jgi:IS4 transposase